MDVAIPPNITYNGKKEKGVVPTPSLAFLALKVINHI